MQKRTAQQFGFAVCGSKASGLAEGFGFVEGSVSQSIAIRMHIVWESELSNKIVKELRLGGQLLTGGSGLLTGGELV